MRMAGNNARWRAYDRQNGGEAALNQTARQATVALQSESTKTMRGNDMPFQNPSVAVAGGLEVETGRYYAKVVRLEDQAESQYGPQIIWKFELATLDGEVLLDDRGFNAEFWQWSSPKISTGGKRPSKAYEWGTALLPDIDIMSLTGEQFAQMVIGTKALALIGPNENGNIRILNLSPMPAKNGSQKATAPKAATSSAPAKLTPPEEPPDDSAAIESDVAEAEAAASPW